MHLQSKIIYVDISANRLDTLTDSTDPQANCLGNQTDRLNSEIHYADTQTDDLDSHTRSSGYQDRMFKHLSILFTQPDKLSTYLHKRI